MRDGELPITSFVCFSETVYVADKGDSTSDNSISVQFAYDSTIYKHSDVNNINRCCQVTQADVNEPGNWSPHSNLLPNIEKQF